MASSASKPLTGVAAAAGLGPPEQGLKCPRCNSPNTKFCYYNNYSLTQPRHFCKSCRRYWTKGGALRNVPVGGGCRKNKKARTSASSSSSSSSSSSHPAMDLFHPFSTGASSSSLAPAASMEPGFNCNGRNNNFGSLDSSIEALHWGALQQQRMQQLLLQKGCGVSFVNSHLVEPICFGDAELSKAGLFGGSSEISDGPPRKVSDADGSSAAWYLDRPFAVNTDADLSHNGISLCDWNGGIGGWSTNAQHLGPLLPP